jgi:hypothetical protein
MAVALAGMGGSWLASAAVESARAAFGSSVAYGEGGPEDSLDSMFSGFGRSTLAILAGLLAVAAAGALTAVAISGLGPVPRNAPRPGFGSVWSAAAALLSAVAVASLAWSRRGLLAALPAAEPAAALRAVSGLLAEAALWIAAAVSVAAVAEYAAAWLGWRRSLRMTRGELLAEARDGSAPRPRGE